MSRLQEEKNAGETRFPTLPRLFRPILHIVLLVRRDRREGEGGREEDESQFSRRFHIHHIFSNQIWKNSKHYNTPARLVVLMRELSNSLITQVRMARGCEGGKEEQMKA